MNIVLACFGLSILVSGVLLMIALVGTIAKDGDATDTDAKIFCISLMLGPFLTGLGWRMVSTFWP